MKFISDTMKNNSTSGKNTVKTTYKYRINEFLEKLPFKDYKTALRIIPAELKITARTFNNYRSILVGEDQDIPHEKIMQLETIFGVSRGELENFSVDTKPLSSIMQDEEESPIVTKYNLQKA